MTTPLSWRSKILLFKIETTYGVDAVPVVGTDAILATDVTLQPMEGSDVSRNLDLPYFGAEGTIPNELHQKLSFKVELAPSGTPGLPPAWGPLLRACGCSQVITNGVSVVYQPVTNNHDAGTFYLWIGTTRYVILGCRGTAKVTLNAQSIPYIEFSLTGLFTQPAETARGNPTLTAWRAPRVVSSANTPACLINSVAMVMRSFELDLACEIEPRFLVGAEAILITQRKELIRTQVEAEALTLINPFALAAAQTAVAVNVVHGVGAGNITNISVPSAQMQRPQGLENAQGIKEWPLTLQPRPSAAGNDQWSITTT